MQFPPGVSLPTGVTAEIPLTGHHIQLQQCVNSLQPSRGKYCSIFFKWWIGLEKGMATSSGHPFETFCLKKKKSWCLSSLWLNLLSAVDDAGKHGSDNKELCIYNERLFLQSSSKRFFPIEMRFEISPCCRNGRPLIRHDMTRLGSDWRTKQYNHGHTKKTVSHLFPVPIRHLCSEMPGAICSASRFTAWKNGPPFLKKTHTKKTPCFYIKKFH